MTVVRTNRAQGCADLPGALCRQEVCNPRVFFFCLVFLLLHKRKKATPYNTFGIKAVGTIRPGDDILLRFGLLNDTSDEPVIGEVSTGDFLAVYDKKMLWRANLYIAETGVDWNDEHPWVDGNEWNRVLSKEDYDNFVEGKLITTLTVGDGGQVIDIADYSFIRTGGDDKGKVAYDYPEGAFKAFVSPFDFMYKLLRQKENIGNYYTNGVFPDPVTLASGNTMTLSVLKNWNKTGAPSNKWENYRGSASGGYEPYLPGLGLFQHAPNHVNVFAELKGQFSTYYSNNPNAFSAGVDCVGFVQRSASYDDANYKWTKLDGNITEGAALDERIGNKYPATENAINYITDIYNKESIEINGEEQLIIKNLDKVIPGDIVYYGNNHIMLIQSINVNGSERRVQLADLAVVESTSGNYGVYGGVIYFTTNNRTLRDLSGLEKDWIIGRLK